MYSNPIQILLIEDDPDDAFLLKESFAETSAIRSRFVHANCLSAGIKDMAENTFDIVLLDLNLPDSRGLDTLSSMVALDPRMPIVVLTGLNDQEMALKTVQAGAQDYLIKDQANAELLSRAIRYAIERQRLLNELEGAQQREREARELNSMDRIYSTSQPSITAQTFGVLLLKDSAPEFFAAMVQHFEKTLGLALEERVLRVDHSINQELQNLAEQLGSVKAGPRDVIDIYIRAVKMFSRNIPPKKARVAAEEGRLLVLELMGDLVSFYRKYFSNANRG